MELTPLAQGQINFIVFVSEPLFALLCQILPEIRRALASMQANLRLWRSIQDGSVEMADLAEMTVADFIREYMPPSFQEKALLIKPGTAPTDGRLPIVPITPFSSSPGFTRPVLTAASTPGPATAPPLTAEPPPGPGPGNKTKGSAPATSSPTANSENTAAQTAPGPLPLV